MSEELYDKTIKIMGISEKYPDLKANENYIALNSELVNIENELAESRKIYNNSVKIFNTKIEMMPGNLIAKFLNIEKKNMFEASKDEKDIKLN